MRMSTGRYWYALMGGAAGWASCAYFNLDVFKKIKISAGKGESEFQTSSVDVSSAEPSSASSWLSQIAKFGFPSFNTQKFGSAYVSIYDHRMKVPICIVEFLTKDCLKANQNVEKSVRKFFEDKSVYPFQSKNEDYENTSYVRGHLAPAGNYGTSQELVNETYAFSNIVPQDKMFNSGLWNQLENHTRKLTKNYEKVYVCTGVLHLPGSPDADGRTFVNYEVIGKNRVSVPTHFYKIILCETAEKKSGLKLYDLECYKMENKCPKEVKPLKEYMVTKEEIEENAGSQFFKEMPPRSCLRFINGVKAESMPPN